MSRSDAERHSPLAPWQPQNADAWELQRVVHLHRRAGFAATWGELQRDLADEPDSAVRRLLDGTAYQTGVPEDFEAMARLLGDAAVSSQSAHRLKAWWVYRMLFSPDPLRERLALMWHNHFATSNRKVADVGLMKEQNDLFRELAFAPFGELLTRVVRHPAMLLWLDADANRREHPNENLARELMELFTLGVGNYTETDVREAARALTGWSVRNRQFKEVPEYHDDGEKTLLGQTGRHRGDDVLRILLEHPATSVRLARRICELLMGEDSVAEPAVQELAEGLRRRDLNVGWAVETVLRSRAFFAQANVRTRVLGPAEFVVGAARALEMFSPPPSTLLLAEWLAMLGQDLFNPPNVFGWEGGRAWMTTRSVLGRARFAAALAEGRLRRPPAPPDLVRLLERHEGGSSLEQAVTYFSRLLHGQPPSPELQEALVVEQEQAESPLPERTRRIVATFLASPRSQLG